MSWTVEAPTSGPLPADLIGLATAVQAASPEYLPEVAAGRDSIELWLARKTLTSHCSVRSAGELVGFAGIRLNYWASRPLELCRLLVHPSWRRRGIGGALLLALTEDPSQVWASSVEESEGHELMAAAGWTEAGACSFSDDPRRGVVLVPPPGERKSPCRG